MQLKEQSTFENHFISGLCSTDPNFSMQQWDQLLLQAEDSLNMLFIAHDDPSKSAYEIFHGKHNFNLNHGHHLDTRSLYINFHNSLHHGAQDGLMHDTPYYQEITIDVTTYVSWTPRIIKSAKISHFFPRSAPFK